MKFLGQPFGRAAVLGPMACLLAAVLMPQAALATPMVAINKPHTGDTVGAQVSVDVAFQASSSAEPVVRLDLLVDNSAVARYDLPNPQDKGEHEFTYTFAAQTSGECRVSVRATDSTGGVGEAIINLNVKRAAAAVAGAKVSASGEDRTPPVVNIYTPSSGEHVSGTVQVRADARDNVGVTWVVFYVDGKVSMMTNGSPPYGFDWKTSGLSDGEHVLQARAWDAADNEGRSAEVDVFVGSGGTTTAPQPSVVPPAPAVVGPAPAVVAPVLPPAGLKPERAALPVPAPIVKPSPPPAPSASEADTSAAQLATTEVSKPAGVQIAAMPKASGVGNDRASRPSRTAAVQPVPDAALAAASGDASWSRAAAQAPAPTKEDVTVAYQASTPISTAASAMADAATTACAPLTASAEAKSAMPKVAPVNTQEAVSAVAEPARKTTVVQAPPAPLAPAAQAPASHEKPAPLPPAELAQAPTQAGAVAAAMAPPSPGSAEAPVASPEALAAQVPVHDVRIMDHGKLVALGDVAAVQDGVRVVPAKAILTHCGAKLHWYAAEKRLEGVAPQATVDLVLGSRQARVNGEAQKLEVAPFLRNGDLMAPLSFLADAMGMSISIDAEHARLILSWKGK